jgi:hypothetical protein
VIRIVLWPWAVTLNSDERPFCNGGVNGVEIANAVVLGASEGWAGVWLVALVIILLITRRTCHNDDHVLGVGVCECIGRDSCRVLVASDRVIWHVSVVVVTRKKGKVIKERELMLTLVNV